MNISQENIVPLIETIFREQFMDDRLVVTEETSPETIEDWDSLAHINLLTAVESKFGIRFTADEMAVIDSVATMKQVIAAKL